MVAPTPENSWRMPTLSLCGSQPRYLVPFFTISGSQLNNIHGKITAFFFGTLPYNLMELPHVSSRICVIPYLRSHE